jgi:hypothetical protein
MKGITNFLAYLLCAIMFLYGCVSPAPKPAEPVEELSYSFKFQPPGPQEKKLGVTIGIVDVDWGKEGLIYTAFIFCRRWPI